MKLLSSFKCAPKNVLSSGKVKFIICALFGDFVIGW